MVLSSWHCHCENSPGSFHECSMSAGQPCHPLHQDAWFEPQIRPNWHYSNTFTIKIYITTKPESWHSFYHPTEAEFSWEADYVPRWFTPPQTGTHPGTNRARRGVTSLIKHNVSSLHQSNPTNIAPVWYIHTWEVPWSCESGTSSSAHHYPPE